MIVMGGHTSGTLTMTHDRYGRSHLRDPIGQLTQTRHSDDAPKPDGALNDSVRSKIIHYHSLYLDRPEPIVFLPLDDFIRLLFLHDHREASTLVNELLKSRIFIPKVCEDLESQEEIAPKRVLWHIL